MTHTIMKMKHYINILILCALNLGGIYNQSHGALNQQHHNTSTAPGNIALTNLSNSPISASNSRSGNHFATVQQTLNHNSVSTTEMPSNPGSSLWEPPLTQQHYIDDNSSVVGVPNSSQDSFWKPSLTQQHHSKIKLASKKRL